MAYDGPLVMTKGKQRIGLWMIGVCGGVGSTVAFGLAALKRGLIHARGMVTALPLFESVDLVDAGQIVVGGHEVRAQTLLSAVRSMHVESGVFRLETIQACAPALRSMQGNVRPGILVGSERKIRQFADPGRVRPVETAAEAVAAVHEDLVGFQRRHRLEHVVVVNVASSEPPAPPHPAHQEYGRLAVAMKRKGFKHLPSSALYALGALAADCSYVNFTPSTGTRLKAIEEFARERGALYAGRDGKTGESLIKSVLAPMFAMRNLGVKSWVGHNVLGNRDGEVLSDPMIKAAKIKSKNGLVAEILGDGPHVHTSIEFVPSLADWKIAWDFIHFEGFLETKMSLQFVWAGSDSVLAAPLVIDLVRLTALEHAAGRRGRMDHLACFFKDPAGVKEHGLSEQWRTLVEHLATHHELPAGRRAGQGRGR